MGENNTLFIKHANNTKEKHVKIYLQYKYAWNLSPSYFMAQEAEKYIFACLLS